MGSISETDPLLESDRHVINLRRVASNATSQLALVGANVCPIESLDYEMSENDFFKQDWRSRDGFEIFQYVVLKWSLCFLIGLITACVGFFNNLAVENIAGVKFVITSNMMLAQKYAWAFWVFAESNFVLTMFAAVITAFIAPAAAGSGIPEVMAYLNGVDAPEILSLRTLVVKLRDDDTVTCKSQYGNYGSSQQNKQADWHKNRKQAEVSTNQTMIQLPVNPNMETMEVLNKTLHLDIHKAETMQHLKHTIHDDDDSSST